MRRGVKRRNGKGGPRAKVTFSKGRQVRQGEGDEKSPRVGKRRLSSHKTRYLTEQLAPGPRGSCANRIHI